MDDWGDNEVISDKERILVGIGPVIDSGDRETIINHIFHLLVERDKAWINRFNLRDKEDRYDKKKKNVIKTDSVYNKGYRAGKRKGYANAMWLFRNEIANRIKGYRRQKKNTKLRPDWVCAEDSMIYALMFLGRTLKK